MINLDFLDKNGWCIFNESSIKLEKIPNLLIKRFNLDPKIEFSLIQPQSTRKSLNGKNPTFSSTYGFDSFPFHTDTAFRETPSRFLIMKSLHPSNTATTFFNFSNFYNSLNQVQKNHFCNAIFAIKSINGSYYNSCFINIQQQFVRFDPLIMTPQNNSAKHCLNILNNTHFSDHLLFKTTWNGSNILIIDNWKVLHGREKVVELEYNSRKLQRIYVG